MTDKPVPVTVPPFADHSTFVFEVPVMVALKVASVPAGMLTAVGEMVSVTSGLGGGGGGGGLTLTMQEADTVPSDVVAVMVYVPAVPGAVYVPVVLVPVTVPAVAVQITLLLGVPWSVAVNTRVPPATRLAVAGDTDIDSPLAGVAATTVIVEAELRVPLVAVAV